MNTLARLTLTVTATLAAFGAIASTPRAASACGGDWAPVIFVDERPQAVSRAEKQLQRGDVLASAGSVVRSMPHIRTLDAKRSTLVARAQRLLAVALVRSGGSVNIAREVPDYAQGRWVGRTDADRAANLEWAVQVLRRVNEVKANDPSVESDLGEALSARSETREEGKALLEKLAQKDLIASPEAYAALARLREAAGDSEGTKLAVQRCEAMSNKPGLCVATSAKS